MMISDSQATTGYGARSRSRSRSVAGKRRSIARSRSVPAISMVPRSLTYDGTCSFARSVAINIGITSGAGFTLGASTYGEMIATYSPLGITFWGSNVNYSAVQLPQVSEISAMWERIRIDKVILELSTVGTDTTGSSAGGYSGRLMIANDYNGPTGGSGGNELTMQCTGCKTINTAGDQPVHYHKCVPKYQRLVQYTALNSSTEPASGFVDSSTDIPHYGTRIALPQAGVAQAGRLLIVAKFYFTAKNIK